MYTEDGNMTNGEIKTAVITGEHEYDVVGFQSMLRSLPGIDAYPQDLWDFVFDSARSPATYDVLVFFNYHQITPAEKDGKLVPGTSKRSGAIREMLEGLGDGDQGIFLLHHALKAFADWPLWRELSGMRTRGEMGSNALDQTVHIDVADTEHPITATLDPWDIVDETYDIDDADEDSHILLTTDHPQSMKTIAWTRTFGKARVFCYQNGEDNQAYSNPGFRTVVERGIQWLAGRQTTIINDGRKL